MDHKTMMKNSDKLTISNTDKAKNTVNMIICAVRMAGKVVVMRFIEYSGEQLKQLRKEFKLNQKDLMEPLNVSQSYVSQFETNVYEPNGTQLKALQNYFSELAGYKIVFYFDHENKNNPKEFWGHQNS